MTRLVKGDLRKVIILLRLFGLHKSFPPAVMDFLHFTSVCQKPAHLERVHEPIIMRGCIVETRGRVTLREVKPKPKLNIPCCSRSKRGFCWSPRIFLVCGHIAQSHNFCKDIMLRMSYSYMKLQTQAHVKSVVIRAPWCRACQPGTCACRYVPAPAGTQNRTKTGYRSLKRNMQGNRCHLHAYGCNDPLTICNFCRCQPEQ